MTKFILTHGSVLVTVIVLSLSGCTSTGGRADPFFGGRTTIPPPGTGSYTTGSVPPPSQRDGSPVPAHEPLPGTAPANPPYASPAENSEGLPGAAVPFKGAENGRAGQGRAEEQAANWKNAEPVDHSATLKIGTDQRIGIPVAAYRTKNDFQQGEGFLSAESSQPHRASVTQTTFTTATPGSEATPSTPAPQYADNAQDQ